VQVGSVRVAVVGDHGPDGHAFGREPGDGTTQERRCRRGVLVVEDFDVGEASGVIDGDVAVLPAGASVAVLFTSTGDAMARDAEPAQLLDIDVDELAGMTTAVPVHGFGWTEPPAAVQPEALQDGAHRRGRHPELAGDAWCGPPQSAELFDLSFDLGTGPVGSTMRS
jgi:hypothetical protein